MPFDFAQVLIFSLLAVGFVLGALIAQRVVAPSVPNADKAEIYECGERPIGEAWFNYNPRFYMIALIFVVFDVEIAFLFPWARVYQAFLAEGNGGIALFEGLVFIVILFVALVYVWVKGDLEWVKAFKPRGKLEKE